MKNIINNEYKYYIKSLRKTCLYSSRLIYKFAEYFYHLSNNMIDEDRKNLKNILIEFENIVDKLYNIEKKSNLLRKRIIYKEKFIENNENIITEDELIYVDLNKNISNILND